jgi:hypothetical protein
MNALDSKGRIVLNEKAIELVGMFVALARSHTKAPDLAKDEEDVHVVLDSLTICGYAVIPEGQIDAVIEALMKLRDDENKP